MNFLIVFHQTWGYPFDRCGYSVNCFSNEIITFERTCVYFVKLFIVCGCSSFAIEKLTVSKAERGVRRDGFSLNNRRLFNQLGSGWVIEIVCGFGLHRDESGLIKHYVIYAQTIWFRAFFFKILSCTTVSLQPRAKHSFTFPMNGFSFAQKKRKETEMIVFDLNADVIWNGKRLSGARMDGNLFSSRINSITTPLIMTRANEPFGYFSGFNGISI